MYKRHKTDTLIHMEWSYLIWLYNNAFDFLFFNAKAELAEQSLTKWALYMTNVYCNYGSQEARLVKHKLHRMNSKGIWYKKKHTI